jgi:hypothetical protein
MTATFATPRLELLDGLIDAGLEVDRLVGHLRGLGRRLVGARRHLARTVARHPLGYAYLHRIEGEYGEVMGQLAAARLRAQALCRVD